MYIYQYIYISFFLFFFNCFCSRKSFVSWRFIDRTYWVLLFKNVLNFIVFLIYFRLFLFLMLFLFFFFMLSFFLSENITILFNDFPNAFSILFLHNFTFHLIFFNIKHQCFPFDLVLLNLFFKRSDLITILLMKFDDLMRKFQRFVCLFFKLMS